MNTAFFFFFKSQ